MNFFSHRVVGRWNALDQHTVDAPSISTFKGKLDKLKYIRVGSYGLSHQPPRNDWLLCEATQDKIQGKILLILSVENLEFPLRTELLLLLVNSPSERQEE